MSNTLTFDGFCRFPILWSDSLQVAEDLIRSEVTLQLLISLLNGVEMVVVEKG
jgi:hypothetical protein